MTLPKEFVPPWKDDGPVDLVIGHWNLGVNAAGRSGLYETTKELAMAESAQDGVLGVLLDNEDPKGGTVDQMDGRVWTYAHNFAYKWCDIHIVHYTVGGLSDRLKPKMFAIHGTPEAMLYSELNPAEFKGRSFTGGLEWMNSFESSFCFSKRHLDMWQNFAHNGPVSYVPKGVNLERFRPNGMAMNLKGEPRILYGEIYRGIKDPFLLLFALKKLREQYPSLRFHPWGFDELRIWTQVFAAGGFADFLGEYRLAGRQSYPEHWYRGGDMTICTNVWGEPARVGIESMACGTPTIAWDTDKKYDDAVFNATADAFDIDSLVETMATFWETMKDDPDYIRKQTRELAEKHYDIQATAKAVVKLVEQTLGR